MPGTAKYAVYKTLESLLFLFRGQNIYFFELPVFVGRFFILLRCAIAAEQNETV